MSEIQNITPGLIPVGEHNGKQAVSGRALHEFLEIETPYNIWFGRMLNYGFDEDRDFQTFLYESSGGRPSMDHALALDMAKELSMIQRTDKGKRARLYFIEMEKKATGQLALTDDQIVHQALTILTAKTAELEAKVEADAPKVDYVDRFVGQVSDAVTVDVFASQFGSTGPKVRDLLQEKRLAVRKFLGERWSSTKQCMEKEYEWRPRQGVKSSPWFDLRPQHNAPRLHNGQVKQTMYVRQFHAQELADALGLEEVA